MARSRSKSILIALFIVVAALIGATLYQMYRERRTIELAFGRAQGTITYRCRAYSDFVDRNSNKAGPVQLDLILRNMLRKPWTWRVQSPGSPPVPASTFDVKTGDIGGSQGLRWRTSDGTMRTAILSFNDIVGQVGPATIWIESLQSGDQPASGDNAIAGKKLTCDPDSTSFQKEQTSA